MSVSTTEEKKCCVIQVMKDAGLLLKLKKSEVKIIDEAFESAVHQYTSCETNKKLWLAYIKHRLGVLSTMKPLPIEHYQSFVDLFNRCLMSVPARTVVARNKNVHWIDYSFHNNVLDLCMKVIPVHERSQIYRKAITNMPDNVQLGERVCEHEMRHENYDQARVICGYMLTEFPKCLPLWKKAIQVELKCNYTKEARWLYEESTKHLPFTASLWKDFATFEISVASNDAKKLDGRLQEIISRAEKNGVHLSALLPQV